MGTHNHRIHVCTFLTGTKNNENPSLRAVAQPLMPAACTCPRMFGVATERSCARRRPEQERFTLRDRFFFGTEPVRQDTDDVHPYSTLDRKCAARERESESLECALEPTTTTNQTDHQPGREEGVGYIGICCWVERIGIRIRAGTNRAGGIFVPLRSSIAAYCGGNAFSDAPSIVRPLRNLR